jgi:hypothetical protein
MMDHPRGQHPADMEPASRQALPSGVLVDYSRIVDILERPFGCRAILGTKESMGLCIAIFTSVVKHLAMLQRSIRSCGVTV